MTRLFLLFYIGVLTVLAAAWIIHGQVSQWQYGGELQRIVEGTQRGGVRMVQERLEEVELSERGQVLRELNEHFDYPVTTISANEVPDYVHGRFDGGADLVAYGPIVFAPLSGGMQFVRLGPFPQYKHYEDSLAGGMRLAVMKLRSAEPAERAALLKTLSDEFGYNVSLIDGTRLPEWQNFRFAQGDDIVFMLRESQGYVLSPLPGSDDVVQFGPFPNSEGADRRVFATTLALVLVMAAIAIAAMLRPIARQLKSIEKAAHTIADGDLSARVDTSRVSSARALAMAFNEMAGRTESLVRTQRELLQAVSHELRTPLSRMRFAIDLIDTAATVEERRERLDSLDASTEELNALVGELLTYVRMESGQDAPTTEQVSLNGAVETILPGLMDVNPNLNIVVDDSVQTSGMLVIADLRGLQRVLSNLLSNAARYARSQIRVSCSSMATRMVIDIDDDGPGIPEPDKSRVLDPFVRLGTAEGPEGGVGLGLAIVRRIVNQHGGSVEVLASDLGGARIRTTWNAAVADSAIAMEPVKT